jgi:hypothetical protein
MPSLHCSLLVKSDFYSIAGHKASSVAGFRTGEATAAVRVSDDDAKTVTLHPLHLAPRSAEAAKRAGQDPTAVCFLSIEPLLEDLGEINLDGIHWVIVGGESGAGARPMQPEWVLSIRDQCQRAQVPFFFKQWGGTRKKKAGRTLDERTYDEMPPRIELPVLPAGRRLAAIAEAEAGLPSPGAASEPNLFAE